MQNNKELKYISKYMVVHPIILTHKVSYPSNKKSSKKELFIKTEFKERFFISKKDAERFCRNWMKRAKEDELYSECKIYIYKLDKVFEVNEG